MQGHKKYTNQTFTKKVDHEGGGRHRTSRSMPEPAVCNDCGNVYADRRWSQPDPENQSKKHPKFRPAHLVLCPACQAIRNREPRGFLHLEGKFLALHHDEIERLLKNEAAQTAEDNPLARIIDWQTKSQEDLLVTTTTEHLAQRLGHAMEKTFDGEVRYDFSHENKLARVYWHRD